MQPAREYTLSSRPKISWVLWASLGCALSWGTARCPAALLVNEFLASNNTIIPDPQNEYEDWIEIYNAGATAVDVGGMYLTDNLGNPTKWQFPPDEPEVTAIAPGGFLLVWADGDTADPGLHASFNLSAAGEEIGLFDRDGATLLDSVSFGPQIADVSYGRHPDGADEWQLMDWPTPGEGNLSIYAGVVAEPQFSHARGFYDAPFALELTTPTEGAEIYYRLDSANPIVEGGHGQPGTRYAGPIPISRTTCVRAAAVKTGWRSSATVTATYIFLDDVVRQPAYPPGFPSRWGSRSADYAMDQRVVNDPAYSSEIEDDLKSTPAVCLVIPNADFFESGGIYANPMVTGDASERAASVEWIDPSTGEHFGVNAGVRIHGGPYSRGQNPKNALRVIFRSEYGLSRLEYPLFPDSEVTTFNTLALRSIWNYSWTGHSGMSGSRHADYLRDAFARDTVRDMGRLAPHGRGVQVYINGLYWGLYIMTERPDEHFVADHLGGDEEDYDMLEAPSGMGASTTMEIIAGGAQATQAWNTLFTLANGNLASPAAYEALQAYVDLPTMIDYMLMVYYTGSRDAPVFLGDSYTPRNFYAARLRDPASPFIFVPWDTEWALEEPTVNRVGVVGVWNPHYLMDRLAANPDFRILLADRIHLHFHNGGALTRERTTQRYLDRADEIRGAIVGESARWGDSRRPAQPYTRTDWEGEVDRLVTQYFSGRTETVLGQLRTRGWYPSVEAPLFQINGRDQHGGVTPADAALALANPGGTGTVWYTLDGSDPRVPGSAAPAADQFVWAPENAAKKVLVPTGPVDDAWRGGAAFDDSAWLSGTGGVGFERSSGYEPYFKIDLGAPMYGRNASCYIRIPFEVPLESLKDIGSLSLRVRYDDAFVAYLNGQEVQRALFTGPPAWNSSATANHDDREAINFELFDISAHIDKLNRGANVLALQGLNAGTTSSDFLISVELVASKAVTGPPSGVAPTAVAYAGPITLNASVRVKARVLSGGTWSALSEAVFAVGPVAESLRISELMYHPAGTKDPNAEYVELTNIGTQPINLNLVRFTDGVDFIFPSFELAPGGYCLVVKDLAAFQDEYAAGLPVAGQYAGNLSNAGERLELQDAVGNPLLSLEYDDRWFASTDGGGFSLTAKDPAATDPNSLSDRNAWRPSTQAGGSPGAGDSLSLQE